MNEPGDSEGEAPGRFWDLSASGGHILSRPIVLDGLKRERFLIEIPPRKRVVGGRVVDVSREAVDRMAGGLASGLSLTQRVLAVVAVRIHLRRGRAHLERSRELKDRWARLARRAREAQAGGGSDLRTAWEALEAEEGTLEAEGAAPHGEDLRHPFILNLVRASADPGRPRARSAASAMQTLVEAIAETLSRTDLTILEIALRRGIRDEAPDGLSRDGDAAAWEGSLLFTAESEFIAEFPWAEPFRSGGPASGALPKAEKEG